MIKAIEKAQKEIDAKRDEIKKGQHRQKYHFMAETGWINDPNGLIYFNGKYHFFYQYNPYSGFWSAMHWGHAVSDDMLHWEYLPLALAPSEWYDGHPQGGCFSGSAVVHEGKLYLIYTGTANNGKGFEQTQCVAYSEDGIHFEKYAGNPVITAPEGVPGDFFRDPYVWKHEDTYYMILGASVNGFAQALLYKSQNLLNWEKVSVLCESRGEWGYMWECPNFFEIDGKHVLVVSPMGCSERTCVYMVGDFDYETGKFFPEKTGECDWGFQYYAPQPFIDDKGRRIMVAWANCWDWMPFWKDWGPTYREGWCGSFNIPRTVRLNDDLSLSFEPIEEVKAIRKNETTEFNCELTDGNAVICDSYCYDSEIIINLKETAAEKFSLILRKSGENRTVVTYDLKACEIRFDLTEADGWSKGIARAPLNLIGKDRLDIRILSDRSSLEIFNDDYRVNLSCNVYTTAENEENYIEAAGGKLVIESIKTWELETTM